MAINIVELFEKNPITRLNGDYQCKFISKIQENFTEAQQNMFVASFYCYLNYNQKTEFVIDLDNVWKWLGFGRNSECKRILVKHFVKDVDYKVENIGEENTTESFAPPIATAKIETRGGWNKEKITMNINTFKKLCLKSRTKKADEIHDYFIKLEEIFHETISEECEELRNKLKKVEQAYTKEKEQIWKISFRNKYVVYLLLIEENLIKYGYTKNFEERLSYHKRDYGKDIQILFIIETKNNELLETLFENNEDIKYHRTSKEYNGETKNELIRLDKNLCIKTVINVLVDANKIIDTLAEIQITKKYDIDVLNFKKPQEQIAPQIQPQSNKKFCPIVKEFIDTMTEHSVYIKDAIKMKNLYSIFVEWIKEIHPQNDIIIYRQFSSKVTSLSYIKYSKHIPSLSGTSGIYNRKVVS